MDYLLSSSQTNSFVTELVWQQKVNDEYYSILSWCFRISFSLAGFTVHLNFSTVAPHMHIAIGHKLTTHFHLATTLTLSLCFISFSSCCFISFSLLFTSTSLTMFFLDFRRQLSSRTGLQNVIRFEFI